MAVKLEIQHITTGYPSGKNAEIVLQKDMNAVLEPGRLVCVLGPNGAGKSTLLRTLAGFQRPLSGNILYGERPLKSIPLKALARKVSVVLTDRFSDLYLTAFDVVRMGRFPYLSFWGKLQKKDVEYIRHTMEKLGLAHLMEKLFYNLSDGERQKVLIARALVQDTPFLMLDEPVAFIDSPGRIEIMELLHLLARNEGKAVLMTTHDLETALLYADTLWLLHRQKPLVTGIPEDLVVEGKVAAYFRKPGLHFDAGKGRFVPEKRTEKSDRKIFVSSKEIPEIIWLVRALERTGYRVERRDSQPGRGLYVCFAHPFYILYRNGKKVRTFEKISGMLENLPTLSGSLSGS